MLYVKICGIYGDVCECGNMCAQRVPPASYRVPNTGMKETMTNQIPFWKEALAGKKLKL